MRVSIPGVPGVYYDTDSGSSAIGVAMTAAGRKVPKPKGYAIQLLPYLWSFDVDLHEVPNGHPIQYLHPEGAQSLGELSPERGMREAGTDLEGVLRFVWSVNQEIEATTNQLIGRRADHDGVVIEIQDGSVGVDGEELRTDEFDIEEEATGETEIDIEEGSVGETEADPDDEPIGFDHSTNDVDIEDTDTDDFEPDEP
ncbi:hypothetical protein [Natronorubrum texcoconense]|uniref:Uncharacterized protein n=1 Tax=Natronorubrum texcoconense TaxID=1095776 RepID=A0A1G9EY99_9EURY|nr:hypothetical protein [Natronorubrum texcoconense]SDK80975.1 hypothetical protein SAMN04515672_4019 [Natronorubrum texcoconense]